MTLKEIASSKKFCEELVQSGELLDIIKAEITKINPANEEDEIFNIVIIGNRVVKFGPEYDIPDFDMGGLAASVLELTFSMEKVNDVPFTNAAAYLTNIGEFEKALDVCLAGIKRFASNMGLINKAKESAELAGRKDVLKTIEEAKKELFENNPQAVADESMSLIMNWKADEAKKLTYTYLDSGKEAVPKLYSNLFFAYNQGFKDSRTESITSEAVSLIDNSEDGFWSDAELAYNLSLFFVQSSKWQEAEKVIKKYRETGKPMSHTLVYESLSVAIISKDKQRVEGALKEFYEYFNKDNRFFDNYTSYAFANVSNCYALTGDKEKTLEYLGMAKKHGLDIGYVKTMDDYKFILDDPQFLNLF